MANEKLITTAALIAKFQQALDNHFGYIWATAGVLWTQARQDALEKTTDSDRAQGRKYGAKWIGHHVADCSGLFKWAFVQLGGDMYHGSNTMYLKWCVDKGTLSKGKRSDGKTLRPGTAVFVWNGKTYSHVGLYIGNDTVIEAANTIKGVTTSKVTDSKWSHWGELKGVTFDGASPEPQPEPVSEPTIRRGSKGETVRKLQTILTRLGYDIGSYGIDGDFGRATEAALKEFQRDHKLTVDGICGPASWRELLKTEPKPVEKKYTVKINGLTKTQADEIKNKYPGAIVTEE